MTDGGECLVVHLLTGIVTPNGRQLGLASTASRHPHGFVAHLGPRSPSIRKIGMKYRRLGVLLPQAMLRQGGADTRSGWSPGFAPPAGTGRNAADPKRHQATPK